MSSTFCQSSLAREPRKRSRAPCAYQASAPSCSNAAAMRALTASSLQDFGRAVALLAHEHRDRHAPGALARDHPVGPALDHAVDAVLALPRHPARDFDRFERAMAQRVAISRDVLVHRDEPLRRIAEDDRLLRAPRMRILMLEPAARDQHAGVDQRLDHRLVGVALLALVGEHAFAGEARRLLGEAAIGIDGVRNCGVDMRSCEQAFAHSQSRRRSPLGRVRAPCARSQYQHRR